MAAEDRADAHVGHEDRAPNGCVSSKDDRPAAWEYDGDAASAQSRNGGDTAPRKMSDGAV